MLRVLILCEPCHHRGAEERCFLFRPHSKKSPSRTSDIVAQHQEKIIIGINEEDRECECARKVSWFRELVLDTLALHVAPHGKKPPKQLPVYLKVPNDVRCAAATPISSGKAQSIPLPL